MNSVGFQRAIAWFPLVLACGGWPAAAAWAVEAPAEQRQTPAATAKNPAETPSGRNGAAEKLVAAQRERFAAMSEAELARKLAEVEARCTELKREGDPIESEYRRQLAALRDSGQFSATAFGAIARKRQALLQKWIRAVAELAALPKVEGDPLVQAVLEAYSQEVDDSKRLESSLVVLTVDDRLPDGIALGKARELLRALENADEHRETEASEAASEAGQRQQAEKPEAASAECRRSNAKVNTAPACSARHRSSVPCKRHPRCGCRAARAR
jgi:hypothetical protein